MRMLEILTKICDGHGEPQDINRLEQLAKTISTASLCGLGQSAPYPVLSTLRYFRHEYEAHIYEKRCPAGVCSNLLQYYIDQELCRGCGACARACPANAITGERRQPHTIDPAVCIKCGNCVNTCKFGAVLKK